VTLDADPCPATRTLEEDLDIALRALDENDAEHAARHLEAVLATDPNLEGVDDALHRWWSATPDPLSLVSMEGGAWVGRAALRAFTLHHVGRVAEGACLLLQALVAAPAARYLPWVADWLNVDEAIAALDPAAFGSAAYEVVGGPDGATRAPVLLRILQRRLALSPPHALIEAAAARCARYAGDLELAGRIAEESYRREPNYVTAIGVACVLRDKGDFKGAIEAYRSAAAFNPEAPYVWLDVGDLCIEAGRPDDALAAYGKVLEREPAHEWALSSVLFLKWQFGGDTAARRRLGEMAREAAPDARAAQLERRVDPHAYMLPAPSSSLVQVAAQCLRDNLTPTKLSVSSIEPPSAVAVLDEVARLRGVASPIPIETEIPAPDPRLPRRKVAFQIWTYDEKGLTGMLGKRGVRARPALAPPPGEFAQAVGAIAATPYEPEAWRTTAAKLGRGIGATAMVHLAAVMAHPPKRPPEQTPWDWLFRVQTVTALALAGVDEGWEGSARREALSSLLDGPVDWCATAAILAMTEIARAEPTHAPAIAARLCAELDEPTNPIRWQCIRAPLTTLLERLPVSAAVRAKLAQDRRSSLAPM
jgi:tetratricopeptide (TPR) repeat protein